MFHKWKLLAGLALPLCATLPTGAQANSVAQAHAMAGHINNQPIFRQGAAPAPARTSRKMVDSYYGAIAVPLGTQGHGTTNLAANYDTETGAKEAAVSECQRDNPGRTCEVIIAVRNSCIALVRGEVGQGMAYGVAAATSERAALRAARQRCESVGGQQCTHNLSGCFAGHSYRVTLPY